MSFNNNHSATAPFLGYLYQIRMSLLMSFDIPEDSVIYIEKGDDIEIQNLNNEELIQLKHKKENEVLTDYSPDFWKSVIIWLKSFDNKKNSSYYLYTTSKFKEDSVLKKICAKKTIIFDLTDLEALLNLLNKSKNKHLVEVKESFLKLPTTEQINFFNKITIIENNERIDEVKNNIIDFKLRFVNIEHRNNFFEEFEGWWLNKVIDMMSNNLGISVKEITLKATEINQKYFLNNLPSPFEFFDDIDYTVFFEGNFLFLDKGKNINLKKSQLKWCILDFLKTSNDRDYWVENALISWDEIQRYEQRLEQDFQRHKDMIYDDEDNLTIEERIEIGKQLFLWVQDLKFNIRSHVQATHLCKGTFHIIADDIKRNFKWLP